MTTLAELTLELAKIIVPVQESVASANGTTVTLIDTLYTRGDNYFKNGEVWFLSGVNAGKIALCTGYVKSTGTITFSPAVTATVAGDRYAAVTGRYKFINLVKAINQIIGTLGKVRTENTDLITVDGQEEYDLPEGVRNLCKVEIAQNDVSPMAYYEHLRWDEVPSEFPVLRLASQYLPLGGYTMRLTYNAAPVALVSYDDEISDYIPIERVIWPAAVAFIRALFQDLRVMPAVTVSLYNEAKMMETKVTAQPLPLAVRSPRLSSW